MDVCELHPEKLSFGFPGLRNSPHFILTVLHNELTQYNAGIIMRRRTTRHTHTQKKRIKASGDPTHTQQEENLTK